MVWYLVGWSRYPILLLLLTFKSAKVKSSKQKSESSQLMHDSIAMLLVIYPLLVKQPSNDDVWTTKSRWVLVYMCYAMGLFHHLFQLGTSVDHTSFKTSTFKNLVWSKVSQDHHQFQYWHKCKWLSTTSILLSPK